eukprot:CAMPEP_0114346514 /NCGR_PEP_ID=MMETSP0101-20121206/13115_1 /TAXON_ID=38822 ORGANISM="Pteridomonas danica, Strain PT" /NCGR_SAMPLE_ID=MMETSP0101 /ASSEMBLY_ACC=CAM_ASM_000211 /LENGTH=111 /DNA_ID=CAMNT_0001483177 /DNA_START=43 /DNA_END=378 /DNA_ORIENTATION=-
MDETPHDISSNNIPSNHQNVNLLDDIFQAPAHSTTQPSSSSSSSSSMYTNTLSNGGSSTPNLESDPFSSFMLTPSPTNSTKPTNNTPKSLQKSSSKSLITNIEAFLNEAHD